MLLSREVCVWILQEYTDDTAELRKQLDALGGMAALQDPETQLLALPDLEQFVSAVGHLCSAVPFVVACLICATQQRKGGSCIGCVSYRQCVCTLQSVKVNCIKLQS